MPESAPPDSAAIEQEISALEAGVGQLIRELTGLRERAAAAEREHGRLTGLLLKSGVDAGDPASLERRLRELSDENSRLREILREAKVRADRIRGRLIVMEDESAG